jgi:hypothetical protein
MWRNETEDLMNLDNISLESIDDSIISRENPGSHEESTQKNRLISSIIETYFNDQDTTFDLRKLLSQFSNDQLTEIQNQLQNLNNNQGREFFLFKKLLDLIYSYVPDLLFEPRNEVMRNKLWTCLDILQMHRNSQLIEEVETSEEETQTLELILSINLRLNLRRSDGRARITYCFGPRVNLNRGPFEKSECSKECSICYDEYDGNDVQVIMLGCFHIFHSKCILDWLKRNFTCPNCREHVRIPFLQKIQSCL